MTGRMEIYLGPVKWDLERSAREAVKRVDICNKREKNSDKYY